MFIDSIPCKQACTGPLRAHLGLPVQGPWEFAHWQNVGPLALALHGQPSLSLQEA